MRSSNSTSAKGIRISFILAVVMICCDRPSVETLNIAGNEFISCDIDRIDNRKSLKLSEITRKSDLIVLKDSLSRPEKCDYKINSITLSSKYIALSVYDKPTRLYDINGQFIKLLDYKEKNQSKHRFSVDVQIDDQNDLFYILAPGGRIFQLGLTNSEVIEIPKYSLMPMGFTLINNTEFLAPGSKSEGIWGYRQKIGHGAVRLYYCRTDNYKPPYSGTISCINNEGNKIVVSFPHTNDTVYLFKSESDMLLPLFACHSSTDLNTSKSPGTSGQVYFEERVNHDRMEKRLVLMTNRYYVVDISEELLIIDRQRKEASFLSNLCNDLINDSAISFRDDMNDYSSGYAATNGCFTLIYNAIELKNMIHSGMKSDSIQMKELISSKQEMLFQLPDSAKVLLINWIEI